MPLRIIKNSNDFEDGIKEWLTRPVLEHTWANLKTHFEDARELLRKIRGPSMTNTAYQQANLVAYTLCYDMACTKQNLLQLVASLETENSSSGPDISSFSANAMTSNATQLAILTLLKEMREDMIKNRPSPRNNRFKHYCWTHGRCNHKSN